MPRLLPLIQVLPLLLVGLLAVIGDVRGETRERRSIPLSGYELGYARFPAAAQAAATSQDNGHPLVGVGLGAAPLQLGDAKDLAGSQLNGVQQPCDPSNCPAPTLTPCQMTGYKACDHHMCRDDGPAAHQFTCECLEGYQLVGQTQCQDIDECVVGQPCKADEGCFNTKGSYLCIPYGTCPLRK